jgi:KEOPS complex subunit Pcc1
MISLKSAFTTRHAENIYRTMLPELDRLVTDRSSVHLEVAGDLLVLAIESDDPVAMRSTLNTWYRLVNVAYETCRVVERRYK